MATSLRGFLVSLLSLACFGSWAQQMVGVAPVGGSDAIADGLFAPAKSVVESLWNVDFSRNAVEKGPLMWSKRTVYNSEGFALSVAKLDEFGDSLSVMRYLYEDGRLLSIEHFSFGDGDSLVLVGSFSFFYSPDAPDCSFRVVEKDGRGAELASRSVNRNGMEVDFVESYNDMTSAHCVLKYDAQKRLVFRSVDHFKDVNGAVPEDFSFEVRYKIGANGLPERSFLKNKRRERKSFSYDYLLDSKGNWIRCVVSCDGVPQTLQERVIEY